ncbi:MULTISPECIES: hypothetical protein [Pseudomonas]|uniref:hypothetical protein n=1 Tax=Pseudomonas TaxID=286 RepID=UPI000485423A|nr:MULTISPECIES: hypothetical protein [Pseudomonas]USX37511.1 hypothetical protein NH673_03950 [Pseudomonas putida]HDS1818185.1 hypothetical protein [Pseudomonas putida]
MDSTRIGLVATALKQKIYTETFGGKTLGKFLISRESLKQLLGVSRLSTMDVEAFTTECLNRGLTVIDLDDSFAFADERFVRNWRKAPNNLIRQLTEKIDFETGVEADFEDEIEEEDLDDAKASKKPQIRDKRRLS